MRVQEKEMTTKVEQSPVEEGKTNIQDKSGKRKMVGRKVGKDEKRKARKKNN